MDNDKFVESLKREVDATIDSLLESIPVAKTNICKCGRVMTESKGMWWCQQCSVWKVKNAKEIFASAQQPYIPLQIGKIIIEKEENGEEPESQSD